MGLYENKNNSLSLLAGGTCYADSPVGAILPFGGSNPPSGYLLCDGQAVSRSYYAELFAIIGTSFGSGDGSTTFNIPNLKGKTTVGLNSSDTDFNAIGKSGGEKTHKLTVTELPSHAHKTGISTTSAYGAGPAGSATAQVFFAQAISDTSYIGGNGAHNNLQPYVTTNYIIKAKQSALPLPFEDAIDDKIATLDVASVGGSGKYISAISETDGKISATETALSTTPTSGSAIPITSGGVYTATQRSYVHRPFSTSLNVTLTPGVAGVYILFVEANPATMQANMTGQLLKNSTSLTYNTVVNAGSASDYSILSIFAIAEITATDTLRFVVTGATGDSSYNHYGYARVSM